MQSVVVGADDGVEVQGEDEHGVVEEAVAGILFLGVTVLHVTITAGDVCVVGGGWVNFAVVLVLQGRDEQDVVEVVVELQIEIFLVVEEATV